MQKLEAVFCEDSALQYTTKAPCFMQDSQQGGELDGICSTSYTSVKSLLLLCSVSV